MLVFNMTKEFKCKCGAQIIANHETLTITHPLPECAYFREVIERNCSGDSYVKNTQYVSDSTEIGEAAIMVRNLPSTEIFEVAKGFGYVGSDVAGAARYILREMRKRGYHINWPD